MERRKWFAGEDGFDGAVFFPTEDDRKSSVGEVGSFDREFEVTETLPGDVVLSKEEVSKIRGVLQTNLSLTRLQTGMTCLTITEALSLLDTSGTKEK